MATGTNIGSSLDTLFPNLSTELSDTTKLELINQAIAASWPKRKRSLFHDSTPTGDIAATTYAYTVTPVTDTVIPEWGIGRVWVTQTDLPSLGPLHEVEQRNDDGTWYLYVGKSFAVQYAGKTFEVMYQTPPAELSALSGTLPVSEAFVLAFCAARFSARMFGKGEIAQDARFGNLLAYWQEEQDKAYKRMVATPSIAIKVAT